MGHVDVALVSSRPLAHHPPLAIHDGWGRASSVYVTTLGKVSLTPKEQGECERFHVHVWSLVLGLDVQPQALDDDSSPSWAKQEAEHRATFWVLPMKKIIIPPLGDSRIKSQINWAIVRATNRNRSCDPSLFVTPSLPPRVPLSEYALADDMNHLTLWVPGSCDLYAPKRISWHMTPRSPHPSVRYRDFVQFYQEQWRHTIVDDHQPLVEVRSMKRGPRHAARPGGAKDTCLDIPRIHLAPEMCRVFPIPPAWFQFVSDLPFVLSRLEINVQRYDLWRRLDGRIGWQQLSEALTMPSARCNVLAGDYRRLEFLGNSVLKYLAVRSTLSQHPTAHDVGVLDRLVSECIGVSHLARIGERFGLERDIQHTPFRARDWRPTGFSRVPLPSHSSDSRSIKALPSVVKALIGAAYDTRGIRAAEDVAVRTGIVSRPRFLLHTTFHDTRSNPWRELETVIGYSFVQKEWLVEAMTHASLSLGRVSYERLEWIGDSVVNLLVTAFLFRLFPDADTGQLSILRQKLIRNHTLGLSCLRLGLYSWLSHDSPGLVSTIHTYINKIESEGVSDEIRRGRTPPKALADLWEAVVGAICVDSGYRLDVVWHILCHTMLPFTVRFYPARQILLDQVYPRPHTRFLRMKSP